MCFTLQGVGIVIETITFNKLTNLTATLCDVCHDNVSHLGFLLVVIEQFSLSCVSLALRETKVEVY